MWFSVDYLNLKHWMFKNKSLSSSPSQLNYYNLSFKSVRDNFISSTFLFLNKNHVFVNFHTDTLVYNWLQINLGYVWIKNLARFRVNSNSLLLPNPRSVISNIIHVFQFYSWTTNLKTFITSSNLINTVFML